MMSKRFTKIICGTLSAVVVCGVLAAAGCDSSVSDKPLSSDKGEIFTGDVVSNGGFAVEKGNYIYFINGIQGNSANNDYGKPVRGAIYRIAKSDYSAKNYLSAECVVPLIAYSGKHTAGLYIYGDEIYYSTPSTVKNADGEVQYKQLEMRSTKLDRTATSAHYARFENSDVDFRYVKGGDGKIYLLYVMTDEKLYNETTGVKNIHSVDISTGTDKLLAYNIDAYLFDSYDLESDRLYYTMNVYDYSIAENTSYNQIYTVTADAPEVAPEDRYGDLTTLSGWDKGNEEEKKAGSIYKNSGTLVFDGAGKLDKKLPFNYPANKNVTVEATNNGLAYKYTLKTYGNGNLLYLRTASGESGNELYILNDGDALSDVNKTAIDGAAYKTGFNPVDGNASAVRAMDDGTKADTYKYVFEANGRLSAAIISETGGGITMNKLVDGKFGKNISIGANANYYTIVPEVSAGLLFVQGEYLYYSVSGGNGYSVNRVKYGESGPADYEPWMPSEGENSYPAAVKILDIDANNDWYLPEIIQNQLLFPCASSDMATYNYIMACDLRSPADSSKMMSDSEIRKLNETFEGVDKIISGDKYYGNTTAYPEAKYANLKNALKYAFYSGDNTYYNAELQAKVNKDLEADANRVLSDETLKEIAKFFAPATDSVWGKYETANGDKIDYSKLSTTVNGKTIYANMRDYYYSIIGSVAEGDAKGRVDYLQSEYGIPYTEETASWFDSLSLAAKIAFIVGVSLGGLIVVAGVAVGIVILVRRGKKKPQDGAVKRRRIKVDTTDDHSIDVYNVDGEAKEKKEE